MVFPVHPRTRKNLQPALAASFNGNGKAIKLTDPLGYLDFLKLISHARLVLTDSGGVQEETTVLGVPCLTLRTTTERPVTITEGTNVLVGLDPERIVSEGMLALDRAGRPPRIPRLWDGRAAARIVDVLTGGL